MKERQIQDFAEPAPPSLQTRCFVVIILICGAIIVVIRRIMVTKCLCYHQHPQKVLHYWLFVSFLVMGNYLFLELKQNTSSINQEICKWRSLSFYLGACTHVCTLYMQINDQVNPHQCIPSTWCFVQYSMKLTKWFAIHQELYKRWLQRCLPSPFAACTVSLICYNFPTLLFFTLFPFMLLLPLTLSFL